VCCPSTSMRWSRRVSSTLEKDRRQREREGKQAGFTSAVRWEGRLQDREHYGVY